MVRNSSNDINNTKKAFCQVYLFSLLLFSVFFFYHVMRTAVAFGENFHDRFYEASQI